MLQDTSDPTEAGPSRRPRHPHPILILAIAVVVLLLAGAAFAIHHLAQGYYVESPGSAPEVTADAACKGSSNLVLPNGKPCVRIVVPGAPTNPLSGQLFMVDVLVGPATSFDYILGKLGWLSDVSKAKILVPAVEVTGGGSAAAFACASAAQMSGAQEAAPVAAMSRLGYQVNQVNKGAGISEVVPGSPAAAAGLQCNQVITAIDGVAIHTTQDLLKQLRSYKVGDVVSVTTTDSAGKGAATVKVKLAPTPVATAQAEKEPTSTPFLGIGPVDDVSYNLPYNVTIEAGDIGGPSAGLAFTLGIVDLLSGGKLTGSAKVAATGEIEANGTVDAIGGVAQKAVAVERAGATVFLVPQANYADAKKAADSHLKVEPVTTLDQALADLAALGGTVPSTDFAASHPPPPAKAAAASSSSGGVPTA